MVKMPKFDANQYTLKSLTPFEATVYKSATDAVGMKPSDDPKADRLVNSNLNQPEEQYVDPQYQGESQEEQYLNEEPQYE